MEIERRTYTAEFRVDSTLGKKNPVLRGYAARFNTLSESMPIIRDGQKVGTFREQLMPGCFAGCLAASDVRALINHDPNLIMGRNTAGTLRIREDENGLSFEIDPPETSYSKDIQVSMNRGDITQCSFGFNVAPDGDELVKDPNVANGYIRSIRSISNLLDVSLVTYPAYTDTSCAVRSIVSKLQAEEDALAKRTAEKEQEEAELSLYYQRKRLDLAERSVPTAR